MLIEEEKTLLKNQKISSEFNGYFDPINDSLELYDYPCDNINEIVDDIDRIILKFRANLSIKKIKLNFNAKEKFTFRKVTVNAVEGIIKEHLNNKVAGVEV